MSSPFAKFIVQQVELPNDPPHTVTIRKLSGRAVERAQAIAADKLVNGRGFAKSLSRAIDAAKSGNDMSLLETMADPLKGFDRASVLADGIVGWSYKEPSCDLDGISQLDDETSELLARTILQLTKPELFTSPEIERKNG